ncbi:MAG: hypothetical protein HYV92_06160 [Candidatus Rokubacteria bacterium]|nr:hypothetical protein [Candidatus Rokubacteria bacterium]MBI2553998.1 hypothetical protein [Candidatus Rokubacteria bacterium]
MTIAISASVKGKEYPPFAVTVERGRIKDFAPRDLPRRGLRHRRAGRPS